MKIRFSALVFVILSVFLSACVSAENNSSNTSLIESTISVESAQPSSETDISSAEESSQSSSSIVTTSSKTTESKVETSENALMVGNYKIFDSNNSRGLDTKKYGYSFGVAKDGIVNSQSVKNQEKFDSLEGVNALVYDKNPTEKCMYLTFDNGYEYKNYTADILDTLKQKNVKAAFFVTLDYVKKNHNLVRRMIDEGHIVGNHSAKHKSFPTISRKEMATEIYLLEDYLIKNFGYESKYFRFPSGEHSHCSLELVSSMGYRSIFWSLAYADWDTSKQPTKESAIETVTSRYHNGAVILLHAVSSANTEGLSEMIDIAHSEGYTFKTLDEFYNK